jgi:hypothetical protein
MGPIELVGRWRGQKYWGELKPIECVEREVVNVEGGGGGESERYLSNGQ